MLQLGLLFFSGLTEENWDEATASPKPYEMCWGEDRKIVSKNYKISYNIEYDFSLCRHSSGCYRSLTDYQSFYKVILANLWLFI